MFYMDLDRVNDCVYYYIVLDDKMHLACVSRGRVLQILCLKFVYHINTFTQNSQ